MVVVGLTGGIATGKTVVSEHLADLGAVILNADKVGHDAYLPHTDVWEEVVKAFGREIVTDNDEIDRRSLAA
jgi:dephospho-CoA kinase